MPKPSSLKKYLRIVKLLEEGPHIYYSISRIKAHLQEQGFGNLSDRTLLRDFSTLGEEFGVPVEYSTNKKGWYLNKDSDQDLGDYRQFIRLLELAERVESIRSTFRQTAAASRLVVFEEREYFKGSHLLAPLVEAIGHKAVISFTYQSYEKPLAKSYRVEPFLIKEYSNRWYLLGWDLGAGKLKTFGLDRMEDIFSTGEVYTDNRGFRYHTLFKNTYGITCLNEEPQRIVLSFTPKQGQYIKSLPLHHSQELLEDTKNECRIRLLVVINYELKKEILGYGDSVKVLEPMSLREEIKKMLEKAIKSYEL